MEDIPCWQKIAFNELALWAENANNARVTQLLISTTALQSSNNESESNSTQAPPRPRSLEELHERSMNANELVSTVLEKRRERDDRRRRPSKPKSWGEVQKSLAELEEKMATVTLDGKDFYYVAVNLTQIELKIAKLLRDDRRLVSATEVELAEELAALKEQMGLPQRPLRPPEFVPGVKGIHDRVPMWQVYSSLSSLGGSAPVSECGAGSLKTDVQAVMDTPSASFGTQELMFQANAVGIMIRPCPWVVGTCEDPKFVGGKWACSSPASSECGRKPIVRQLEDGTKKYALSISHTAPFRVSGTIPTCTAFMVGPSHVMTARHCVCDSVDCKTKDDAVFIFNFLEGPDRFPESQQDEIEFRQGWVREADHVVVHGDPKFPADDWALVKLEDLVVPLGATAPSIAPIGIDPAPPWNQCLNVYTSRRRPRKRVCWYTARQPTAVGVGSNQDIAVGICKPGPRPRELWIARFCQPIGQIDGNCDMGWHGLTRRVSILRIRGVRRCVARYEVRTHPGVGRMRSGCNERNY